MHKAGIDTIAFYSSHYFLELSELAAKRNVDPSKYAIGLGQYQMAVPPPGEDIVTMGANAASAALKNIDKSSIEMVLFATETGIDQSKAAGIYLHDLLGLPERCRVIELKQACYSATFAIQMAMSFLQLHPDKKVLLVASDIARYGLQTPGEPSQGAGSVAMVLSVNPRILVLDAEYGVATLNVMDFWRPNYSDTAFVDGKYSAKIYLNMLEKTWRQYSDLSQRQFHDIDYFCYHTPVARLAEKAHHYLARLTNTPLTPDQIHTQTHYALAYPRIVGNSYAASLFIGFTGLVDYAQTDLTNKRVGFYSYGSGCVAEFFSGLIQPGYRLCNNFDVHQSMLKKRIRISYDEYVNFFNFSYPTDGSVKDIPVFETGLYRLIRIDGHKRYYEVVP